MKNINTIFLGIAAFSLAWNTFGNDIRLNIRLKQCQALQQRLLDAGEHSFNASRRGLNTDLENAWLDRCGVLGQGWHDIKRGAIPKAWRDGTL